MAAPGEGRKGREMLGWGILRIGDTGFLYFFLFSALHCCHQVCPGVAAIGAAELSWGGPGAPRKHVRVPLSTAPAFFPRFWLKCLCGQSSRGVMPSRCALHQRINKDEFALNGV